MKKIITAVFMVALAISGYSQDKKEKPVTSAALTESEQKEWAGIVAEASALDKENKDVSAALMAANSDSTMAAVGWRFKAFLLQSDTFRKTANDWVAKAQSAHNCPDCAPDKDGKNLVKVEKK